MYTQEQLQKLTHDQLINEYGNTINEISTKQLNNNAMSPEFKQWSDYQHSIIDELNTRA